MPKRPSANKAGILQSRPVGTNISDRSGLITAIVALLLIVYIYFATFQLALKILLAVGVLLISGELLARLKNSQRIFWGVYMIRTQLGLGAMDSLSKRAVWFWNGLADWGLVLGFGLLSALIFKKTVSKRMMVFGVVSLVLILVFVIPYSILGLSFVNIQPISSKLQGASPAPPGYVSYTAYIIYGLSFVGGFVLYVIVSLAYNAFSILYGIAIALSTVISGHPNYTGLSNSIPGVAPIIPGITIPLFAGVLALAVLLAAHEFSHGILARTGKIKIKSSGALLFGIIPIGAFVEPDEDIINKSNVQLQNRISAAGVAANMLLCLLFLFPMLGFAYYVMPHYQQNYVYISATASSSAASGMIVPGSVIQKWNGYNISTISDFKIAAVGDTPGANVSVITNKGSFILKANSTGKVGVIVQQSSVLIGGIAGKMASFLYTFFALSFLLNFLIAVVNYLPIPSFDGWRIFNSSIKNKKLVLAITAFVIAAIVVNVLPWIWLA